MIRSDAILIGSGIMSANLGALLKCLSPALSIKVFEATEELAQESSHGWHNAGTGHAGICELSYTPHREADGSVNVQKAIDIYAQFSQSLQFWSYALAQGMVDHPREFINAVPHLSFVHGEAQVDFLRARYEAMSGHHFFRSMEFTTDRDTIARWAPLLTEGRAEMPIAATKMDGGTDVNFGVISRRLLAWLGQQPDCTVAAHHRVTGIVRSSQGWRVTVKNLTTGAVLDHETKFVFVGAGGGSLPLLQKTGIPESKGLGGFPIGGQWLVCEDPAIVNKHQAKVYGQALDAAPTMAVPHLDTRVLDGKKTLLFGPFAAWTTKFLHEKGSPLDLPLSVRPHNLTTLLKIGMSNVPLVRYLIQQGTQSMEDRMKVLRIFYPNARPSDWKLVDAGIRVQAIKKTDGEAGIVHYGTEVITDESRSIAALLGASPGASVSVNIVLDVIKRCSPELVGSSEERKRLDEMVPGWNVDFTRPEQASRFWDIEDQTEQILGLTD